MKCIEGKGQEKAGIYSAFLSHVDHQWCVLLRDGWTAFLQ